MPQTFLTFFAASLAADGALIGLLFVAIAIEPEKTFGEDAKLERELAATGAFNALLNAFLISMLALVPGINVGWAVIVIAALSLLNTVVYAVDKRRRGHKMIERGLVYTIGGLLVFGLEIVYGIQLIQQPRNPDSLYSLVLVLVAEYGVALVRAWTLLGAERRPFTRVLIDVIRGRRALAQPARSADNEKKSVPSD